MFHQNGLLMRFLTLVAQLVEVQLMWLWQTLKGGIVLGIFPATFAMFDILRDLIRKGESFSIRNQFKDYYKKEFKHANIIGLSWLLVGALFVMNFRASSHMEGTIGTIYFWLGYAILVFYALLTMYGLAVYSHFDLPFKEIIKYAAILIVSFPIHSLLMFGYLLIFILLAKFSLILLPLIDFSLLAYLITFTTQLIFKSLEKKQEKMKE